MFVLAVLGNVTYGLGIFLYSVEPVFLLKKLPWIVGSVGTLFFDFTVSSLQVELTHKRFKMHLLPASPLRMSPRRTSWESLRGYSHSVCMPHSPTIRHAINQLMYVYVTRAHLSRHSPRYAVSHTDSLTTNPRFFVSLLPCSG